MRIVVCVKNVPDIKAPLEINDKGTGIIEEEAHFIVSRADKVAVEFAIGIKESLAGVEVVIITLGSSESCSVLRECLTLGADRAVLLQNGESDQEDPLAIAARLADGLKRMEADLILCGSYSEDNQNAAVGLMIAELLCLPSISNVAEIKVSPGKEEILVNRKLQKGSREIIRSPLPAVITVDKEARTPRYSSLPAYMRGLEIHIEKWDSCAALKP